MLLELDQCRDLGGGKFRGLRRRLAIDPHGLPRGDVFRTHRLVKWCSAISRDDDIVVAARAVVEKIRRDMDGVEPNLVLLFVSQAYQAHYREVAALVGSELPAALILGCTAQGVIGAGEEIEADYALSLTAAALPGVTLKPFHIDGEDLPEPQLATSFWASRFAGGFAGDPVFLLLPDPFSIDVENLVAGLGAAFPRAATVGGSASGGAAPGENALYLGTEVYRSGAVGVALSGNVELETIVSQGCRPIGHPMFVTRCRENLLFELDGRPALQVAEEVFEGLPPEDQRDARKSMLIGLGIGKGQGPYALGDFLVRNLVGKDNPSGALLVGARLRENQIVQFQLRDATTAEEDLELRLAEARRAGCPSEGALLFSCLSRGAALYGVPNHDSHRIVEVLGEMPVGGFFANGEVGPVAGQNFVHGYTSVIGLFRERAEKG